ncbi:EEP domain-containing protein [Permianibacter sp. IMCC34836]|uniref:endonuclease/exonuclease/phosphatase family protein n=1 Tax=Permianibacter fluminis TaxID=2738515 RepID=UPI001551F84D|nr:endonuclease/exonuclease/phosphatase family protein [Permianibacter fluminis]NQD36083.1 EEP domain-containing protein [Permianibacter fluminis]
MTTTSLRLLSWNIQCGITTERTSDYLTRGWRHLLPHKASPSNLRRIAGLLTSFDVVALQEADGGSLRSGFINQVEYLADLAGFPYWHAQRTRNLAQLGQHGNGLLSRYPVRQVHEHRLPGLIPGRGAIQAFLGGADKQASPSLVLVAVHLSLGKRARRHQLDFLAEQVKQYPYLVLMGDTNCEAQEIVDCFGRHGMALKGLPKTSLTFPSWQPQRQLDHILVSAALTVQAVEVLPYCYSDHLPVAMALELPEAMTLGEASHRMPLAPGAMPRRLA